MIWHDYKRVEQEGVRVAMEDRIHHHFSDLRNAEVERAGASVVQNSVHGYKGFAGFCGWGKRAIRGEAAVESPGEEGGMVCSIKVR